MGAALWRVRSHPAPWCALASAAPSRPVPTYATPRTGKNWVDVDIRHCHAHKLTYIVGRQGVAVRLDCDKSAPSSLRLLLPLTRHAAGTVAAGDCSHDTSGRAAAAVTVCGPCTGAPREGARKLTFHPVVPRPEFTASWTSCLTRTRPTILRRGHQGACLTLCALVRREEGPPSHPFPPFRPPPRRQRCDLRHGGRLDHRLLQGAPRHQGATQRHYHEGGRRRGRRIGPFGGRGREMGGRLSSTTS